MQNTCQKLMLIAMKRNIPLRDFDNRFGAPMIRVWELPPEDHIKLDVPERPWEQKYALESYKRARLHKQRHWAVKHFEPNYAKFEPQSPEDWTIFPGDLVQVMVGKDKGKQGIVSHVIREYNSVFVDGLHMKMELNENPYLQRKGLPRTFMYKMQPLDPTKGQVKLVDPNDNDACDVEWHERSKIKNQVNESKQEKGEPYVRISKRTGYVVPFPSQAYSTYDYISKETYIDSPLDTPTNLALQFTYVNPQIKTFEQEINEEFGIKDDQPKKPTYWY
ncbi:putative 39S ribosomal protein L24, mitochondrial [Aphelenchoides bicaudatus]|nr:putative 39S ribosomal protein L24, mitochondrial [Aphelenchoides bicaudatus]